MVTPAEFEALEDSLWRRGGPSEFTPRFSVDVDGRVAWGAEVCRRCDPFNYRAQLKRVETKDKSLAERKI